MSATRPVRDPLQSDEVEMRSFWLPPDTIGNGIDADSWAVIAQIEPARADQVLRTLAAAGVAACAAATRDRFEETMRVYVDPLRYARAENVLLSEMSRPAPKRIGT